MALWWDTLVVTTNLWIMDAPLRVIALHGGSVSGFQPVKHRLEKGRSPIMYKIDTLNIRCQLDTEVSIQNHITEVVSCLYPARLSLRSQSRHHPLHPFLPDVGVNRGGGDALVPQQRLNVHQFRPGVEQVGVSSYSRSGAVEVINW